MCPHEYSQFHMGGQSSVKGFMTQNVPLLRIQLCFPDGFGINFTRWTEGNKFIVKFINTRPTVNVRYVIINAQIGPGWVENQ